MCHLVSWFDVPKSDAQRNFLQTEIFVDEEEKPGRAAAMEKAEELARNGAREVRLWRLEGQASPKTIIEWDKNND